MGELLTVHRTEVRINGRAYHLAQGQDISTLEHRFEEAAQRNGVFIDFTVVGDSRVSVLINNSSQVSIETQAVQYDPRDTEDEEAPYGDPFGGI